MDRGTAFCFGQFSEETQEAFLIARSERHYDEVMLTTAIRANDVYQRQQGEFRLPLKATFHLAPSLLPAHDLPTLTPD